MEVSEEVIKSVTGSGVCVGLHLRMWDRFVTCVVLNQYSLFTERHIKWLSFRALPARDIFHEVASLSYQTHDGVKGGEI